MRRRLSNFATSQPKRISPATFRQNTAPPPHRKDVARLRRKVELPVHPASAQHQRTSAPKRLDRARWNSRCDRGGRDIGYTWTEDMRGTSDSVLMHTQQVDGKQKVMFALTQIKGVGRRYSNLVCKKADVDLNKRYGTSESNMFARHRNEY